MLKHVFVAAAMLAIGVSAALADTKADQHFATKAYRGNLMEIQLGQLALQKSQNPDIRSYAQRLIKDHSTSRDQLTQLSQTGNFNLPQGLSAHEQKMINHLSSLNGSEFDKAFIHHMLKDHEKDIKQFTHEAQNAQDGNLKSYASQTLPVLNEHLNLARQIAQKLGVKAE